MAPVGGSASHYVSGVKISTLGTARGRTVLAVGEVKRMEMTPEPSWRTCRICEKPIGHSQSYFRCSDPSCNSEPEPLVFCSTACWEAHQATAQHPGASAQPAVAPSAAASQEDDDKPA